MLKRFKSHQIRGPLLNVHLPLQGPGLIIHQPDEVLDAMGDWCKEHHGKVGKEQTDLILICF